jgi:hypothetical protein
MAAGRGKGKPGLMEALLLAWVDAQFARTGRKPHLGCGSSPEAPGEAWRRATAGDPGVRPVSTVCGAGSCTWPPTGTAALTKPSAAAWPRRARAVAGADRRPALGQPQGRRADGAAHREGPGRLFS